MRFILIHGGFHGAWCWSRTAPELARLGHEAVAIDMPGNGDRVHEPASLAASREAIVSLLEPGDVLVGHSGGGYDVTIAADAAPDLVRHVVYLAAGLPLEGRPIVEATGGKTITHPDGTVEVTQLMTDATGMLRFLRPDSEGRLACVDYEGVRDFFYHDCDEQTARWAFERMTPAKAGWNLEPVSVPRFWKAELPRSYIKCLQDRAKPRWMSEQVADRLGVLPLEINTSHSPFLSRPAELAELLVEAVDTVPIGPLKPGHSTRFQPPA
ncbi:MAG TPA: alpha/beta fold hydrolase [Acidimicrobiales bacterium]|nr:alpha/beta fold hydrolase [Acidimicrobiales bacterium]